MHTSFSGNNRVHQPSTSATGGPKHQERSQEIVRAKLDLKSAHLDLNAAKSRLDNAWKDLNATRRSTGLSAAEYQLKQTPPGETGHLEAKIAAKEKEHEKVLSAQAGRVRAAEGDVAKAQGEVGRLETKISNLESNPVLERKPLESSTAPHASMMARPGTNPTRNSPLSQVPAHPDSFLLDDLVPTAGIPFQLPSALDRPGSHAPQTNAQKLNIKPEGAE